MKIQNHQKIHEAADKFPGRYIMNAVQIHPTSLDGKAELRATDGRILAVIPIDLEEGETLSEDHLVPREAIQELLRGGMKEDRSLWEEDGKIVLLRGGSRQEVVGMKGEFPRVDAILESTDKEEDGMVEVTLNVKLLTSLFKALGAENVTLRITARHMPVCVQSGESEAYGVIMPITG